MILANKYLSKYNWIYKTNHLKYKVGVFTLMIVNYKLH